MKGWGKCHLSLLGWCPQECFLQHPVRPAHKSTGPNLLSSKSDRILDAPQKEIVTDCHQQNSKHLSNTLSSHSRGLTIHISNLPLYKNHKKPAPKKECKDEMPAKPASGMDKALVKSSGGSYSLPGFAKKAAETQLRGRRQLKQKIPSVPKAKRKGRDGSGKGEKLTSHGKRWL